MNPYGFFYGKIINIESSALPENCSERKKGEKQKPCHCPKIVRKGKKGESRSCALPKNRPEKEKG